MDERETWPTGAQRDSRAGKGRYDLLPPRALHRVALRFELGATRYGARNWERGMPVSRCIDSALRHLMQYMMGDDAEDHLAAAAWNVLAACEIESRCRDGLLPSELNDVCRGPSAPERV